MIATRSRSATERTGWYDYSLPADRIAQEPLADRDASLLLHAHRDGRLDDRRFRELPQLLREGDLLVVNDTRVRRARVRGRSAGGHDVELLVLHARGDGSFLCLTRPARHARPGTRISVAADVDAAVLAIDASHPGARVIRFDCDDPEAMLERHGEAPLPPYIRASPRDAERYQTRFATGPPASAAAPTAGLHFTDSVMNDLQAHGVGWTAVRLDVGLATFAPIRAESLDEHRMHEEHFELPGEAAAAIDGTRARGGRVVAVGTTVVRVLETCAQRDGRVEPRAGVTALFLRPGHRFRVVDALLTNFHQPRSSLLVLLSAFAGDAVWRAAYAHALAGSYRFLSFGDCMLCWNAAA